MNSESQARQPRVPYWIKCGAQGHLPFLEGVRFHATHQHAVDSLIRIAREQWDEHEPQVSAVPLTPREWNDYKERSIRPHYATRTSTTDTTDTTNAAEGSA